MDSHRLAEMERFERFYWWHVGRRFIIRRLLGRFLGKEKKVIADIGCGTGGNLDILRQFGNVIGVDSQPAALAYCKARGAETLITNSAEDLSDMKDCSVDVLTSFDVLEHVADDGQALREFYRVLRPGGLVFLLVPAYQWLWSEHDVALGHHRRYTANALAKKTTADGFAVVKKGYCITLAFLPVVIFRWWKKLIGRSSSPVTSYVVLPGFLNALFIAALWLESWVVPWWPLPFGVSVILVARKPLIV